MTKYELTFGQVVDQLQEGEVAQSEKKDFIVKRQGSLYYGLNINKKLEVAPCYTDQKWRLTSIFETRVCNCGDLLNPGTDAYMDGALATNHLGEYYESIGYKQ